MTPTTETELKLYTPDHAPIVQQMHALGARLVYPRVFERNVRYENAANSLTASGIVLRLRQDSRARLTYKDGGTIHDGVLSRSELEVEVSDFHLMHLILERLGFHTALTYEKYRTTYEYYGAEIVVDELPYGNFIEIEGDAPTIESIVQALGLQRAQRVAASYIDLFEQLKAALSLPFRDLTFENFAGVAVPSSFFEEKAR
ncbi:MAG: class IV adenylate cyclase [Anaerolinea sp.]